MAVVHLLDLSFTLLTFGVYLKTYTGLYRALFEIFHILQDIPTNYNTGYQSFSSLASALPSLSLKAYLASFCW